MRIVIEGIDYRGAKNVSKFNSRRYSFYVREFQDYETHKTVKVFAMNKMKKLLFLLMVAPVQMMVFAEAPRDLTRESAIGYEYVGESDLLNNEGGTLLGHDTGDYAYSLLTGEDDNGRRVALLAKFSRDEGPDGRYKVIAELKFPPTEAGEYITDSCTQRGIDYEKWIQPHPRAVIFAMARFSDNADSTTKIRRAWQINWKKFDFEEIPGKGVECFTEGAN